MPLSEPITRPKLEEGFQLQRDPSPLVVVDFHVYLHSVLRWYEDKVEGLVKDDVAEKMIKSAWALLINRGPDMLPRHAYRFVIVADRRFDDTGNYGRDRFMRESKEVEVAWVAYAETQKVDVTELKTNYKGTRADKTDNFWKVFNIGWEYVNEYFPTFSCEGFEADDWAGAIYRVSRDGAGSIANERQILLSTLDRDWSQLVDESHNVYFANTRIPFPKEKIQERLVGNMGVIEHTKHRMGFDLDHPKNLSDWKVKHGDLGDNLPPGSPKCLFDLCEPNDQFNVEQASPLYPLLVEELNNPKANDRPDHYEQSMRALAKVGIEPPIRNLG